MKKTWIRVIVICFFLVAIEAVGTLIFIRPYLNRKQVFQTIYDGQLSKSQKYYDLLSERDKQAVNDNLDSYAAWMCEEYIAGRLSYERISAGLDAINSIDVTGEIFARYKDLVNENELVATIIKIRTADIGYDNNARYSAQETMTGLMLRMDSDTREGIMVRFLNERYMDFLDGNLSPEDMKGYAGIVTGVSYYDAYTDAGAIINNVDFVMNYRAKYDEVLTLISDQNYFEAMELCDSITLEPSDTRYKELFGNAYSEAYALGKEYYPALIDDYIDDDDMQEAVELLTRLEKLYGDDIDFSAIQEKMATDWMNSYLSFLDMWEAALKQSLSETEQGRYILDNVYEDVRPNSIALYDVDKDGTPEMFLFNNTRLTGDFTECFMYRYTESSCEYVGYVKLKSFCRDSYMICAPSGYDGSQGEAFSLVAYNGSVIGVESYCQHVGDRYTVNGVEGTDADYLSTRTDILGHEGQDKLYSIVISGLDDAKSYILTYK